MHALITRTLPARTSCRCFTCGRATKSIVRRNINPTSKRRKIGANDVFTACYSSLMASAVIADAEIKKGRRKKWDQAIEDAKGQLDLAQEEEVGDKTYSKVLAPGASTVEVGQQAMPLWKVTGINHGDLSNVSVLRTESKLEAWDRQIRSNIQPGQSLKTRPVEDEVPRTTCNEELVMEEDEVEHVEWADERPIPGIPLRDYVRRQHVDKAEISITKLVKNILSHISLYNQNEVLSESDERYKVQLVLDAIAKLEGGFSKFPNYEFRHAKTYGGTRRELHTSFYKICQRTMRNQNDVDWMLAKLCYNLLVCPVPPSIITLNILLGELHRLQQHDVAEHIVQTYFQDTRFAPTFDTLQLILDHYVAKQDHESFEFVRNRMRGSAVVVENGREQWLDMRLGRRKAKNLNESFVQHWAMQHKFRVRDGQLMRRTPRNQQVFNSLIMGSLAFGNTRQAIRIFGDASYHVRIPSNWISVIVTQCFERCDHAGARRLFRYLMKYWKEADGNVFVELTKDVRLAIYQVMALIGVDLSNPAVLFPKMHFLSVYEREAHAMLLDIYLAAAKDQIDKISKALESLRTTLATSSSSQDQVTLQAQAYEEAMTEYDAEAAQLTTLRPILRETQIRCIHSRVQHTIKRSWELKVDSIESLQSMKNHDARQLSVLLSSRLLGVVPERLLPSKAYRNRLDVAPLVATIEEGSTEEDRSEVDGAKTTEMPSRAVAIKDVQNTSQARKGNELETTTSEPVWQRYEFYVPSEHHAAAAAGM